MILLRPTVAMALQHDSAGSPAAEARLAPPSAGDEGRRASSGAARTLNVQILRLAALLPGGAEHEYGFSCECGCGQTVQLPATEFADKGGAWLDGHRDSDPGGLARAANTARRRDVPPVSRRSS